MTQEEKKELLLKDLCARIPYGLKVSVRGYIEENITFDILSVTANFRVFVKNLSVSIRQFVDIEVVIPYLRSMSSMTEEEKEELRQEHLKDEKLYAECIKRSEQGDNSMRGKVVPHFAADWCNKHHFDYRGLIENNLALEAPEGMYKK